jgi:Protein of unknown function (DUF3667)
MARNKKRIKSATCPNCHTVFADDHSNYCASCGQENHTHKLPVSHFALELLESFTHFDTKFVATFKDLISSPGLVAQKYNDNKRARYVPPIRIYAFVSFAFFVILALTTSERIAKTSNEIKTSVKKDTAGQVHIFTKTEIDAATNQELLAYSNLSNHLIDSILQSKNIKTDWINVRVINTIIQVEKGQLQFSDLYKKFVKSASYAIFFLMPIFALILLLVYRKRNYYYSEFLVFSIYYHTFIFAFLGSLLILQRFTNIPNNFISSALLFTMLVYLGLSIKRVFGESNLLTILKTLFVFCLYLALLVVSIVALVLGVMI